MSELKACGFIIFRKRDETEFLLMRHADRWDLPKGHIDPGESDWECAYRELEEETGISKDDVEPVPDFRFELKYTVHSKRTGFKPQEKSLVIFLAWLNSDIEISPTEHLDYRWWKWQPPHDIQEQTINPLLREVANYFKET